jgi:hypothetical protein
MENEKTLGKLVLNLSENYMMKIDLFLKLIMPKEF